MESDDSDKDRYCPQDQERSDEDELESRDEIESDQEEVVCKKGKKVKPGRHEIAAFRTTVPTTGFKSAVEHSKHRQRSPRSVLWILCNHHPACVVCLVGGRMAWEQLGNSGTTRHIDMHPLIKT